MTATPCPCAHQIAVARARRLAETDAERAQALAMAAAGLAADVFALIGGPPDIVPRRQRLADSGIGQVLLVDPTGSQHSLERFAAEIMPAVQASTAAAQQATPA